MHNFHNDFSEFGFIASSSLIAITWKSLDSIKTITHLMFVAKGVKVNWSSISQWLEKKAHPVLPRRA
ncbi:MAG: hypothetical protein JKY95_13225 [Planctomycetaceae bacterium]|nr:hypothetical protein [Planctomycetaceae bacterium]